MQRPKLGRGGREEVVGGLHSYTYVFSAFSAPNQVAWVVEWTVQSPLPKTESNKIKMLIHRRRRTPTSTAPLLMYSRINSKLVLPAFYTPYILQYTPHWIKYTLRQASFWPTAFADTLGHRHRTHACVRTCIA